MLHRALQHARANRPRFVRELASLCEFRSTSKRAAEFEQRAACANWLAGHLRGIGFRHVRLEPGETAPIVHAEWRVSARAPWLLIYGHYDVQPAEPLAEWRSPPFTPTRDGDRLYGRGATDDKGQFFIHLKALESWSRTAGQPPLNVRVVLEGEEESGSRSLLDRLRRAPRDYAANVALISDTRMPGIGRPSITYSLRGAITFEVEFRGAGHELHSGTYGGAAHDSAALLARWLGAVCAPSGRVALSGFYDSVVAPSEGERQYLAQHGPSDADLLREVGAVTGAGERGFTLFESSTLRPSLSVTGLAAGFTGAGGKSAVPASATARLNLRLVPGQTPERIVGLLREHLQRFTPEGVHAQLRLASTAPAFRIEPSGQAVGAATRALEESFGHRPVFLPSGGTIPVATALRDGIGADVILMGFGVPGDNRHAPNEFLHLPTFFRGVETSIRLLQYLADRPTRRSRRVARLSARRLYP